ncbi:MAG TPA: response regulator [Candidatus Nitrosocosmicus sp.]|nr:response regulator [Candidatus Nitrosocosmicus sp.]
MINKSTKLPEYGQNDHEGVQNGKESDVKDNNTPKALIGDVLKIDGLYTKRYDEQINFINFTQAYCVGFIDVVNSTQATARIQDPKKLRRYYSIFLNSLGPIIRQYSGKIVKNSGDNLFFYFPKTSNSNSESALKDAFDCADLIKRSRVQLNTELTQENLPEIDFRISMDYGTVEVALSSNNNEVDLFGSVVNTCAKMNRACKANGIIIGKRLFEKLSKSSFTIDYETRLIESPKYQQNDINYEIFLVNKKIHTLTGISNYPLKKIHLSSNIQSRTSLDSAKRHAYNILIVDDDEDILYSYSHLLKANGYKVNVYSNPIQALKHLAEISPHGYDLAILDIRMPDINGIKLFYWLKAMDPHMNILFVTALDVVNEFITALPGIDTNDIIKKPLSNAEFLSNVGDKLSKCR